MKFDLLRTHPAFRNLFLGQAISQIGDALYYVAFMFMVKRLTGRDDMVGFVGALEVLPFLLLSPYAGLLADRFDRRKIMVWTDLLSAGVLFMVGAIAYFNGSPPIWTLFVAACLLSCIRVFFFPARTSSVPRVVPEDRVADAFTLTLGTQNIVMLAGCALSASVLSLLYERSPLVFFLSIMGLNGLSFLLSWVFVAKLPPLVPEKAEPIEGEGKRESEVLQGVLFVKKRPDLKTLMFTTAFFCLGVSPFFVTYVAANDQWFGGKPGTLAWFEASFFAGMILGTWIVGKRQPKRVGMGMFAAMLTVAIGVGLMAFSRMPILFVLWNFLCGIGVPFSDIPVRTYLQLTVPDAFRGRVNALHNMLATSMMPLGMAMGGLLVSAIGLQTTFLAMGGMMAASCLITLFGKEFRDAQLPSVSADSALGSPETAAA